MKTEHTPGPWQVQCQGPEQEIFIISPEPENELIAKMEDNSTDVESWQKMLANARLIAAAPEMLEALKSVVQQLNACLDTLNEFQDSETAPEWIKENSATRFICGDPAIVQARAAIKKAEAL